MVKKIKVVDVVSNEVKNEEQDTSVNEEVVNDQPNEVDNELTLPVGKVNEEEQQLPDIEETPRPKAKSKPRAKPKTKPVEIIPEIKEEPIKIEEPVKIEEQQSKKVKKVVELVKCDKCNKMMSQKSLRYTHEQNCKGQEVDINELPVKRRVKQAPTKTINNIDNISNNNNKDNFYDIPEEVKTEICKVIARNQLRMKKKEDNLNKLKMHIA